MPGINQTWWPDRIDRDPARGSRCILDEYRELLEEAGIPFLEGNTDSLADGRDRSYRVTAKIEPRMDTN